MTVTPKSDLNLYLYISSTYTSLELHQSRAGIFRAKFRRIYQGIGDRCYHRPSMDSYFPTDSDPDSFSCGCNSTHMTVDVTQL